MERNLGQALGDMCCLTGPLPAQRNMALTTRNDYIYWI